MPSGLRLWLRGVLIATLYGAPPLHAAGSADSIDEAIARGAFAAAETQARGALAAAVTRPGTTIADIARPLDLLVRALVEGGKTDARETYALAQRAVRLRLRSASLGQP